MPKHKKSTGQTLKTFRGHTVVNCKPENKIAGGKALNPKEQDLD